MRQSIRKSHALRSEWPFIIIIIIRKSHPMQPACSGSDGGVDGSDGRHDGSDGGGAKMVQPTHHDPHPPIGSRPLDLHVHHPATARLCNPGTQLQPRVDNRSTCMHTCTHAKLAHTHTHASLLLPATATCLETDSTLTLYFCMKILRSVRFSLRVRPS